jgi:prepilin-type N-terminal cleavage/methylation domain-containing protein
MRNRPRPDNRGFTLLEMLVVIAILGLLIGLVAPAVLRQLGSARTSIARQSIERIGSILDCTNWIPGPTQALIKTFGRSWSSQRRLLVGTDLMLRAMSRSIRGTTRILS